MAMNGIDEERTMEPTADWRRDTDRSVELQEVVAT